MRYPLFLFILSLFTGCMEYGDPCSEYGIDSVEDIYLTEKNHPEGYGKEQCLLCHNIGFIHRWNCTGLDGIDLEEVRRRAEEGGEEGCLVCHGDNGT